MLPRPNALPRSRSRPKLDSLAWPLPHQLVHKRRPGASSHNLPGKGPMRSTRSSNSQAGAGKAADRRRAGGTQPLLHLRQVSRMQVVLMI